MPSKLTYILGGAAVLGVGYLLYKKTQTPAASSSSTGKPQGAVGPQGSAISSKVLTLSPSLLKSLGAGHSALATHTSSTSTQTAASTPAPSSAPAPAPSPTSGGSSAFGTALTTAQKAQGYYTLGKNVYDAAGNFLGSLGGSSGSGSSSDGFDLSSLGGGSGSSSDGFDLSSLGGGSGDTSGTDLGALMGGSDSGSGGGGLSSSDFNF